MYLWPVDGDGHRMGIDGLAVGNGGHRLPVDLDWWGHRHPHFVCRGICRRPETALCPFSESFKRTAGR